MNQFNSKVKITIELKKADLFGFQPLWFSKAPNRKESIFKALIVTLLTTLPLAVIAEPNIVTIPNQGWSLIVETPPLTSSESTNKDGRFRYIGADTASGITFSIHTEDLDFGNQSNAQCRDKYWMKTKNNPYIIKDSIELFETTIMLGVMYRIEGKYMGQPYKTSSSHGYFVKNGKCVDLHVSQIPYSDEGMKNVKNIVSTARIME